ncbi:MAG: hypothetical protein ACYCUD_10595 [Candidatus Dormibacteria bacterium]
MAEVQGPRARPSVRRPRTRAKVGHRRPQHGRLGGVTRGAFLLFALVALGLLAAGLLAARLTIFGSVGTTPQSSAAAKLSPTKTPAVSSLVGAPVDGTILALSVAQSLIAIQPAAGQPVEALVTSGSKITRGGAPATLSSLIPGEAVIVTFSAGPHGTLIVARLQDIESVPTNTPSPTYVPSYSPSYYPTPTQTKPPKSKVTPPTSQPSPGPVPGSSPPGQG